MFSDNKNMELGTEKCLDRSKHLLCKPSDPSSIPRTHIKMAGENQLHRVVL